MAGYLMSERLKAQIEEVVRKVLGSYISTFRHPVPQRKTPSDRLLAKSTSNISKGSTGDMTVYYRDSSGTPQVSSPTETLSGVMAELGAYTANKLAYVERSGNQWVIYNTECAT